MGNFRAGKIYENTTSRNASMSLPIYVFTFLNTYFKVKNYFTMGGFFSLGNVYV